MNTDTLTTPSPEMKKHAQDLKDHAQEGVENIKKDAKNLAGDVKDHASRSYDVVREEATRRVGDAKEKATDLVTAARDYCKENPLSAFGIGVFVGLVLATWRRRS